MIAIPDPDVVLTDLGLAVLGAYFGARLWRAPSEFVARHGAVVMYGLASAAFWGALFHALFPAGTATPAGDLVWLLVAFSIAVVAESLLDLALLVISGPLAGARRVSVLAYCVLFAGVILFVDESFSTVVLLYAPALILMLVTALRQALRTRARTWTFIAGGLALSCGAALMQLARVAIHPVYFDHNAVYHVLQAAALVVLYLGFRGR